MGKATAVVVWSVGIQVHDCGADLNLYKLQPDPCNYVIPSIDRSPGPG
jgi:hypothetical protein